MFSTLRNLFYRQLKNLTFITWVFFWTVGKISKLEWFHNPSASHKIILLELWLPLMCGVQVWQHSGAFVVQLV